MVSGRNVWAVRGVGVAMTLQSFSGFRGAGFGRYDVAFGGGWAWGVGCGVGGWHGSILMVAMAELMVYSEREGTDLRDRELFVQLEAPKPLPRRGRLVAVDPSRSCLGTAYGGLRISLTVAREASARSPRGDLPAARPRALRLWPGPPRRLRGSQS